MELSAQQFFEFYYQPTVVCFNGPYCVQKDCICISSVAMCAMRAYVPCLNLTVAVADLTTTFVTEFTWELPQDG